jgi:hypothetical protein
VGIRHLFRYLHDFIIVAPQNSSKYYILNQHPIRLNSGFWGVAVQQLSGGTLAQALANADVQRTLANSSAYGVATKTESAIALEGVKAGSRVLHPMNAYHNIKKCGTGLSTVNCFSLRSHQFL